MLPVTVGLIAASTMATAQTGGYQQPAAALQAIVDAPRAPTLNLSPERNLAAMLPTPSLPSISEVAQPELKLAGLRINPRTYFASRFSFYTGLGLLDIDENHAYRARESIMHMLYESNNWLEKYVKNVAPRTPVAGKDGQ